VTPNQQRDAEWSKNRHDTSHWDFAIKSALFRSYLRYSKPIRPEQSCRGSTFCRPAAFLSLNQWRQSTDERIFIFMTQCLDLLVLKTDINRHVESYLVCLLHLAKVISGTAKVVQSVSQLLVQFHYLVTFSLQFAADSSQRLLWRTANQHTNILSQRASVLRLL